MAVKEEFVYGFELLKRYLILRRAVLKLGIYGPTNSGKTTLANRISIDFKGERFGSISNMPHETRTVLTKEKVMIKSKDEKKLLIDLIDTPGFETKIDYKKFVSRGMNTNDAKSRAQEASLGVIDSIKKLRDIDMALVVIDARKDPLKEFNIALQSCLSVRKIPCIIIANKIDLKTANPKKVKKIFSEYPSVSISAKKGINMEELYQKVVKEANKSSNLLRTFKYRE